MDDLRRLTDDAVLDDFIAFISSPTTLCSTTHAPCARAAISARSVERLRTARLWAAEPSNRRLADLQSEGLSASSGPPTPRSSASPSRYAARDGGAATL